MKRLNDKVAIVTGSASGIGRSIALLLAQNGAHVACCDLDPEGNKEVVAQIKSTGVKSLAIKVDISQENEVKECVKQTIDEFGRIDILVNCAAYLSANAGGKFHEEDVTDWNNHIDITLKGTLYFCKAVIPSMMNQNYGRIINITSAATKGIQPGGPYLYPACKAAIATVSKNLAVEVARYGILINCVAPGPIRTENLLSQPTEFLDKIARPIPLKRLGEPEEVANLVLFLASDESSYITGQHYSVDGGLVMV